MKPDQELYEKATAFYRFLFGRGNLTLARAFCSLMAAHEERKDKQAAELLDTITDEEWPNVIGEGDDDATL
jgi:hypothetical protein